MSKKHLLFLAIGIIFLSFVWEAAEAATLSLSPSSGSFKKGETFSVSIILNTSGVATQGTAIRYLNYNPALLRIKDDDSGKTGVQIASGNLYAKTQANLVDSSAGKIEFTQITAAGESYIGSGTLSTVNFEVLKGGTANVNFNFTLGNTGDTNVASNGSDVLSSVVNGSYTLIDDNIPPTGSISINSGAVYAASRTLTLTLSASDASGVSQMSFSNDNVSYSTAETYTSNKTWGLSIGDGLKTVYVKYKDSVGNWNSTPFSDTITMDLTYPSISSVQTSDVRTTRATVGWKTNEPAASQIEYGKTTLYGSKTTADNTLETNHSQTISGLLANTTYHFMIVSKDQAGNESKSSDYFFSTSINGDINRDGVINSLDYSLLMSRWLGSTAGLEEDLNGDGIVDTMDLGIIMSNWG